MTIVIQSRQKMTVIMKRLNHGNVYRRHWRYNNDYLVYTSVNNKSDVLH